MQDNIDYNSNRDKLTPLRKFAVTGVYSVAYLSQLVQRGTLKAQKIGRNYYTTTKWFDEYLLRHARDEKQIQYNRQLALAKVEKANESLKAGEGKSGKKRSSVKAKLSLFNLIAVSTAIFILAIFIANYFVFISDKGEVAGESEENIVATSTNREAGGD